MQPTTVVSTMPVMEDSHIDNFYYATSEMLVRLYATFPVRSLLLVEDITGPIKWDMTGMPDRKSNATFESMMWLAEQNWFSFRTVEPRDLGVEGAVLSQRGFVLLNGLMRWQGGEPMSRIQGLKQARHHRSYSDMGPIVQDLMRANSQLELRGDVTELAPSATMQVVEEDDISLDELR